MAERDETLEKKPRRVAREIAEMAGAQRRLGIVDEATYEKITAYESEPMAAVREMMEGFHQSGAIDKQTMREFDDACLRPVPAGPMALDDESGPAGG